MQSKRNTTQAADKIDYKAVRAFNLDVFQRFLAAKELAEKTGAFVIKPF